MTVTYAAYLYVQSVQQTPLLHYIMAGRKNSYKIPGTEMVSYYMCVGINCLI